MYFNAHCHLELSALGGRIPRGLSFPEWLESLVLVRKQITNEELQEGITSAIDRMVSTGTTVVGDINASDIASSHLRGAARNGVLHVHFYHELLQFKEADAADAVTRALAWQSKPQGEDGVVEGLSPHSPYTTTALLLRKAAEAANRLNQWLCIHAAETVEEREMLVHGRGALRDFLAPFLDPNWKAPGTGPIQWLDACGCLGRNTLLVHCNDITDEDIALIQRRGASVVVCPGSHVWFDRGSFPLGRLLKAGIPVYLGTDSLASNEDLDMEREIQLACELSPDVDEKIIRSLAGADRAGNLA